MKVHVKGSRKKSGFLRPGGLTGRAAGFLILLALAAAVLSAYRWYVRTYDPLYDTMEEDPCWREGVYYIEDFGDYIRFAGYLNRARREEPENEAAVAVDAVLLNDIDTSGNAFGPLKIFPFLSGDFVRYGSMKNHPYIRQCILSYAGTFDGNGHTITWKEGRGNGMFISIERSGVVKNLTFHARDLCWTMDEYGVGMLCMINYGEIRNCRTEGSMKGTECYVGAVAGINRGTIRDCVNQADVTLTGVGEYGAGGIAGLNKCRVLNGESEEDPIVPVIEGCVNNGTIRAPWEAGGICARNDCADIRSCGNEGSVEVQYQRGYLYPDHPDWYDRAMAAGICGSMGWNTIEGCYNTGQITILEEGEEATYGIAGGTLSWINTVAGCVSLQGTAAGSMRHESVMELDGETLARWKEDPDSIPYTAANWQFDLEEAKEKLPLVPLGAAESLLSADREDVWLCREFCLTAPEGYVIKEVSPYALCVERRDGKEDWNDGQMWLLRLADDTGAENGYRDERGNFTKDTAHDLWTDIPGAHWLHPGYSYKDDCHVTELCPQAGERVLGGGLALIHYRDDPLAALAVEMEDGRMADNVAVLPVSGSREEGFCARWLLLFTRKSDNARPYGFVWSALRGFVPLPGRVVVEKGESLSSIAGACTGDPDRYPELAVCNGLPDADHIEPGQVLILPEPWLLCRF